MSQNKFQAFELNILVAEIENLKLGEKMTEVRFLIEVVNEALQQFVIFQKTLGGSIKLQNVFLC